MKKRTKVRPLTAAQRKANHLPQHLSLSPQYLSDDAWYYEEKDGIKLYAWPPAIPGHTRSVVSLRIKWRQFADTMRRYRKFKGSARNPVGK